MTVVGSGAFARPAVFLPILAVLVAGIAAPLCLRGVRSCRSAPDPGAPDPENATGPAGDGVADAALAKLAAADDDDDDDDEEEEEPADLDELHSSLTSNWDFQPFGGREISFKEA